MCENVSLYWVGNQNFERVSFRTEIFPRPDWKTLPRLFEALPPLGILGAQLTGSLKPLDTVVLVLGALN